jgi:hypothetical protein
MAVLLGLPWLAAVLGGLFSSVVTFLMKFLTKRVAIVAATIAALGALYATFAGVLYGLVSGLSTAMPGVVGLGIILPPEAPTLLTSYVTARVAFWVYRHNYMIIKHRMII